MMIGISAYRFTLQSRKPEASKRMHNNYFQNNQGISLTQCLEKKNALEMKFHIGHIKTFLFCICGWLIKLVFTIVQITYEYDLNYKNLILGISAH